VRRVRRKLVAVAVNSLLASVVLPVALRVRLLRLFGMSIAPGAQVRGQCYVLAPENVTLGAGSFVNTRCYLESHDQIVIGARTELAMEVLLCTSSHRIGDRAARGGPSFTAPIEIGSGCWLGARSTVLPGVRIGDGCVIAAGALVVSDCEADGVYAGVPARRVRELE
jgi:acetyltransferase-like isoleucine patch superfamily enzyme